MHETNAEFVERFRREALAIGVFWILAVLSVEVESGRVGGAVLQPVAIADDGRPEPLACPPKRVREGGLRLWHLPGYSLFYRGVVFLQFWLAPRLRAAFSRHLVHKLVRRLRHAFGAAEP